MALCVNGLIYVLRIYGLMTCVNVICANDLMYTCVNSISVNDLNYVLMTLCQI